MMKHRIAYSILIGLIVCGLLGFSAASFAGEWEKKVNLPQLGDRAVGIWGLGVQPFNGKLYGFGGQDDLKPPGKFVGEYDPAKDVWEVKKKWQRGRFRVSSAIVRGKSMLLGERRITFKRLD